MKSADQITASVVRHAEYSQVYYLWFAGKSPGPQAESDADAPQDKSPQSVEDDKKYNKGKKSKAVKDAADPIDKTTDPDGDGKNPKAKTSRSDGASEEPPKISKTKEAEPGPRVKTSNAGGETSDKKVVPSGKEPKTTGDDSVPSRGKQFFLPKSRFFQIILEE